MSLRNKYSNKTKKRASLSQPDHIRLWAILCYMPTY